MLNAKETTDTTCCTRENEFYLSYEFFSYDRHDRCDRYNDMETRLKIHGNIINGSTVTDRTTGLRKKKKDWIELLLSKKVSGSHLVGSALRFSIEKKIVSMDATHEQHVIPLNSEESTFFLNVLLSMAYCKLYRESNPNKMALLASMNNRLLDPGLFLDQ